MEQMTAEPDYIDKEFTDEELEEIAARIRAEQLVHTLQDEHRTRVVELAKGQLAHFDDLLSDDDGAMLHWPYDVLDEAMGGFLPGTLTVIGARPGNGKTTLLLNTLRHWITKGKRILYLGMETRPERLRLEWAALDCGYEKKLVLRRRWDMLPKDAREKLQAHRKWQESVGDLAIFADDERVDMDSLVRWVRSADRLGVDGVVIDHLHRMEFGHGINPTEEMSRGVVAIKQLGVKYNIPIIAAAQLNRGERDILGDYEPPPLEALRQTGTTEQEADDVLMLHRVLKPEATKGDKALVRAGAKKLSEISEKGALGVHIAKCRIDGDMKGEGVNLWVHGGKVYNTEDERTSAIFGKGF